MSNKKTNKAVLLQQKTEKKRSTIWLEKLGTYLIDVSKYTLTGVLISSLFKDIGENRDLIYSIGFAIASLTLASGLILVQFFSKKGDK